VVRHWSLALIGEDTGEAADASSAPVTFATIEGALNWLLEAPRSRDLRVTAVSQEQPVRHVVGHFLLDPNLAGSSEAPEPDGRIVYGPPPPGDAVQDAD
jgi:hypothetical protein